MKWNSAYLIILSFMWKLMDANQNKILFVSELEVWHQGNNSLTSCNTSDLLSHIRSYCTTAELHTPAIKQ